MSNDEQNKNNSSEQSGEAKVLDHNYDGIQELDNMLPRWWLAILYLSIVFAGFYYAYYELGSGQSIAQEFQADVDALDAIANTKKQNPFPDDEKLNAALKDGAMAKKGSTVFQTRCASCHGDKGQGLIGPNLTDHYWINGDGKISSVAKVIYNGVPEKGMPPWGPMLTEDEVYAVTVFVDSLRETHPAGAKAPQGNLVKE